MVAWYKIFFVLNVLGECRKVVVDSGYPSEYAFLGPNKGKRYHLLEIHLPEFHHRGQLRSREELFKRVHSSIRSLIERTFGVWKKRWRISQNMPVFLYKTQVQNVVVSMAFHNYIKRKYVQDVTFNEFEHHPDFMSLNFLCDVVP